MNLVKLQDTKLIHRNLLHSYTQKMKDQKEKLWKQSDLLWPKKKKKIEYLGINLYKEAKILYSKYYKTLRKKIKDDTNR